MFELMHTPTEIHPPSAREFAFRVRQAEKQQALMVKAHASNAGRRASRSTSLVDLVIRLFGGPTLF